MDYFEKIGPLNLIEIPSSKMDGLQNGDYISINVNGPNKETYPMKNETITRVTILSP